MKSSLLLVMAVFAGGCGNDPSPPPRFFFTCGDPVCGGYVRPENTPPCTAAQQAGQMCSLEGLTCDPTDACNRRLLCSREDPTMQPGGCPISLAAWKKDVRYLDEAERRRQHDAVVRLPLATWRYVTEDAEAPARLGFLIDDVGAAAPCVRPSGQRVDLYGYTSMAVAAVQVQAREIESLRAELAALRREVARLATAPRRGE
jgi:hypothetical protein